MMNLDRDSSRQNWRKRTLNSNIMKTRKQMEIPQRRGRTPWSRLPMVEVIATTCRALASPSLALGEIVWV